MKLYWAVANQTLEIEVEHTGHKTSFPSIRIPFIKLNFFIWRCEDEHTLLKIWKALT